MTRFFVPNATDQRGNFDGPVVLHYINPSLSALTAKYASLDPANGGGLHRVHSSRDSLHTPSHSISPRAPQVRAANFVPATADAAVLAAGKAFALPSGELPATHNPPKEAPELPWALHLKRTMAQHGAAGLAREHRRASVLSIADRATWLPTGLLVHFPEPAALLRAALTCALGPQATLPEPGYPPAGGDSSGNAAAAKALAWTPAPTTPAHCRDAAYMRDLVATVRCFSALDCCAVVRNSKGSLKTPPYLY